MKSDVNAYNTASANLLLTNGKFYTMDKAVPGATMLAVSGNRILAVGNDLEYLLAAGGKKVDLGGCCVLPGLTDSHVHYSTYALMLQALDLAATVTLKEVLGLVAVRARQAGAGQWITGQGWDQNFWPENRFPNTSDLDAVAPDNPVVLWSKSYHSLVANTNAMRLAGIGPRTEDPPCGRVGRDLSGMPDGMFFEEAMRLIEDRLPAVTVAELAKAISDSIPQAWRMGLSTIHEMDGVDAFSAYQHLYNSGELGLRVMKYLPAGKLDAALGLGLRAGFGNDWLRIAGIKGFADGALGPHTAAMLDPYSDDPGNRGMLTIDEGSLRTLAEKAEAAGLPLAVHAIGDRAGRLVLDCLPRKSGLRHRMEHVQLLHPDDLPRMASMGVIASMQPVHATQDSETADRCWGARAAHSYAWCDLSTAGIPLAFGSDCPVETLNPFVGIQAAVLRRRKDGYPGPDGWYPQQKLSVREAVYGYTLGAAYAAGSEDRVGSLSPGKLADLIVLNRDIFTCCPDMIAGTGVYMMLIDGKWTFE